MNEKEPRIKSLEERIAETLKERGETESSDSQMVQNMANQIRADLDKKANEARARLKARGTLPR